MYLQIYMENHWLVFSEKKLQLWLIHQMEEELKQFASGSVLAQSNVSQTNR